MGIPSHFLSCLLSRVPNSAQSWQAVQGAHLESSHLASAPTSGSAIHELWWGDGQRLSTPLASVSSSGPQLASHRLCQGGNKITKEKNFKLEKISSLQTEPTLRSEPMPHFSPPALVCSYHIPRLYCWTPPSPTHRDKLFAYLCR